MSQPLAYQPLVDFFRKKIFHYQREGLRIFASSSFQTHSIPMLHILSEVDNSIPVYFLHTGYHFSETLQYKDQIAKLLHIQVVDVSSPVPKINQRDKQGNLYFTTDPDYCCYLNKTLPMEPVLAQYDVWISGVRKDQSEVRKTMDYEQPGKHGAMRFHPMLDWTNKLIYQYCKDHKLPRHPLEDAGYLSIGCEPCTMKMATLLDNDRSGRWFGLHKSECGLHTDLIQSK